MNDQNKTNDHLVRVPHFQNEIGDDLQHLWKKFMKKDGSHGCKNRRFGENTAQKSNLI